MAEIQVNFIAVLVCSVLSFLLGGLWYSPLLFAKKWISLQGKTREEMMAASNPIMYVFAFASEAITCLAMAYVINYAGATTLWAGSEVGVMCWIGFTGATSYNNQVNFVRRPRALWAIDSGFTLISFAISGGILAVWR